MFDLDNAGKVQDQAALMTKEERVGCISRMLSGRSECFYRICSQKMGYAQHTSNFYILALSIYFMKKILALGIVLALLVSGIPLAQAQEENQNQNQALGIPPDSPFYFFQGWMEGFGGLFRGGDPAFHEELAQRRQAEIQYLQERNQEQLIEQLRLRERLQEHQQEAVRIRTEEQTRAGEGSGMQTETQTQNEGESQQAGSGTGAQGESQGQGQESSGSSGQQSSK
jgi:hypothetical protein